MASLTGFPTLLSISTSVSMVNLAVFWFTTSDTRGRDTIRISAENPSSRNRFAPGLASHGFVPLSISRRCACASSELSWM